MEFIRCRCRKGFPVPNYNDKGGRIWPAHSPNPTSSPSCSPAQPRITTVSPSWMNLRSCPPLNLIGVFPPCDCSSKLPCVPGSLPEMVPDPKRSPGRRLQPEIEWWATICDHDHSRFLVEVRVMVVSSPSEADASGRGSVSGVYIEYKDCNLDVE